ncbi:glycoside hydrolase family 79 protein [Cadophora sp. DSE1049]|nr:glycoside hydrolase family 79 protein [Cadophora sp. DSE1049]
MALGSLLALLLSASTFNLASSAPATTFAGAGQTGLPLRRPAYFNPITVPGTALAAGAPVLNGFVSYSIELAFLPDFAGNKADPNTFSDSLLNNLKEFQGSKPNIRVGGNTQDFALFDKNLKSAINATYTSVSPDWPAFLDLGPLFFESYQVWPEVQFIHGFNLAGNSSDSVSSLTSSVPYACKALSESNFLSWEMGNEPNLYRPYSRRPSSWSETDYVKEWNEKVTSIENTVKESCGAEWVTKQKPKWIAPSFADVSGGLDEVETWKAGLNSNGLVTQFSAHNYIDGATQPGVTLAGTLMNHTRTTASVVHHNAKAKALADAGMKLDYILSEANSLFGQGAPGLSNSFGAALWGVDFNLMCAATNIKQVFMHMGTNYRYTSWQPVSTNSSTIGTKPPYYGNIAVAAALGNITKSSIRVQNIPLKAETEAAYAIYAEDKLERLMVINLNQYNYSIPNPAPRPEIAYNFTLPASCAGSGVVQRLIANGSDAITGITFNGISYNYELDEGKPKAMLNVTRDDTVWVGQDGGVQVWVPWSSAALVRLRC